MTIDRKDISTYQRPNDSLVLEGIMTTVSPDGRANISPMGPIVDAHSQRMILRPFKTSTTYHNLKSTGEGVFHITDDALLLARAAISDVQPSEQMLVRDAEVVHGLVLTDACRYYELKVEDLDDRDQRVTIRTQIVAAGRIRDFVGFNRARHAVIEAAILVTRLHLTGPVPVLEQMLALQKIVDKTGNRNEQQAMEELFEYVRSWHPSEETTPASDAGPIVTEEGSS